MWIVWLWQIFSSSGGSLYYVLEWVVIKKRCFKINKTKVKDSPVEYLITAVEENIIMKIKEYQIGTFSKHFAHTNTKDNLI